MLRRQKHDADNTTASKNYLQYRFYLKYGIKVKCLYNGNVKKTLYSEEQTIFLSLMKQVRQNAGLSQLELSQRLEVPQSRISDYERGQRQMDLMELRQYCQAVGITVVDFVTRFDGLLEEGDTQVPPSA